jgi:hypothetical protein
LAERLVSVICGHSKGTREGMNRSRRTKKSEFRAASLYFSLSTQNSGEPELLTDPFCRDNRAHYFWDTVCGSQDKNAPIFAMIALLPPTALGKEMSTFH